MSTASRLSPSDLWREVRLDLTSRPSRSALTALGTLIGIAVLVSTLGLAASLASQISARFDALAATEITVTSVQGKEADGSQLPVDAPERSLRINGVLNAATLSEVPAASLRGTPVRGATNADTGTSLYAASADLGDLTHAIIEGRFFDAWHDRSGTPVAVLGAGAAERLRISDVAVQPVVFINDQPVVVIGIITAMDRRVSLLQSVIVPNGYAVRALELAAPQTLLVETRPGVAEVVGDQLALAIRPDGPQLLTVTVPPSPELTRAQISGDAQALFLVLAAISLVIGGIGIANMTLVSVLERIPEIGLRRAIGACRRHIVTQFLAGSMILGFAGGLAGTAIGLMVNAGVALAQRWPPTMPLAVPLFAPILGAAIGLLAGLYPAYRASRIEPIEALRAV